MQTLPSALVDRLRADVDPSFLVEDFVFAPADFPSLAGQEVVDDLLVVHAAPRTVHRTVHTGDALTASGVDLELWLAVDGAGEAFDVLLAFCGDFSRPIPVSDIVILQDEAAPIGDTGLGWPWSHGAPPSVLAWMRGNLLVTLTGRGGLDVVTTARQIDGVLAGLDRVVQPGGNPYYGSGPVAPAPLERRSVAPGGVLPLSLPPDLRRLALFFFPERGSVNLDPEAGANAWYYRAGLDPAESVAVDVLGVGPGIVPRGARLSVHVA